jgi:hypothetical protein
LTNGLWNGTFSMQADTLAAGTGGALVFSTADVHDQWGFKRFHLE